MGIGGFGMSAIARVMHAQGVHVTGCDMHESPLVPPLRELGIEVAIGHDPAHLEGSPPEALIVSSAVPPTNPELRAAEAAGIPVLKRADVLGLLMRDKLGIAVAGTHGKTTTTAMIAHILTETGHDPSFIIGGVSHDLGTNAHAGQGRAFVIEADEYDGMFLGLRPRVAVFTTLEMDHPDMFSDIQEVRALFARFLDRLPVGGIIIAGADDPEVRQMVAEREQVIPYGVEHGAWRALGLTPNGDGGTDFVARHPDYDDTLLRLRVPGRHNVQNALGALAATAALNVPPVGAAAALSTFNGVGRRFEVKGEAAGITVIDDYAHHPTAIRATLEAARARYPERRIWAVWQPHTFSRTAALLHQFATSFTQADHVIITDVYRSRDRHSYGITPQLVIDRMPAHPDARHISGLGAVVSHLQKNASLGDVVIIMSAGDATQITDSLLQALSSG